MVGLTSWERRLNTLVGLTSLETWLTPWLVDQLGEVADTLVGLTSWERVADTLLV